MSQVLLCPMSLIMSVSSTCLVILCVVISRLLINCFINSAIRICSQFSCLAVDPSGEIVTAGGMDVFDIYVWSLQTGRLLEVLTGHEAPVAALQFSPTAGMKWIGPMLRLKRNLLFPSIYVID